MKLKFLFTLIISLIFTFRSFAQDDTKVKNLHSIKLSYLSLAYNYEHAIAKQAVINSEIKFIYGFGANTIISNSRKSYHVLIPLIRLEPRYYYNFLKRASKEKKTINNSANYLALTVNKSLYPIIKSHGIIVEDVFNVIPKWGLKRTIGEHFIFETAIGLGYEFNTIAKDRARMGFDLNLGYAF